MKPKVHKAQPMLTYNQVMLYAAHLILIAQRALAAMRVEVVPRLHVLETDCVSAFHGDAHLTE